MYLNDALISDDYSVVRKSRLVLAVQKFQQFDRECVCHANPGYQMITDG